MPLRKVTLLPARLMKVKGFLHRFAAAGAAVRYHAVHADQVEDILALDIALRRNENSGLKPYHQK